MESGPAVRPRRSSFASQLQRRRAAEGEEDVTMTIFSHIKKHGGRAPPPPLLSDWLVYNWGVK